MIKFYIALYIAKLAQWFMKLIGRKASYFPGKLAIHICPDFLKKIEKPKQVIAVTGTNGKTTVCNLLIDLLEKNGYKVLNNKFGSNVNAGVASSLASGVTLRGKCKYEMAVLEVDERSSLKIYPYITPNYIICTNLFRDSIRRNAHPEYIFQIIDKALSKETKLILNADDLISSYLGDENQKIYFAIDKLNTDLTESVNIINDVRVCPKCQTKLKYNYVRYHHIGNAYCPKCDFKSCQADYIVKEVSYSENYMMVEHQGKEFKYNLISDSIFNIYNEIAVITLLSEIGVQHEQLQTNMKEVKIVESRYQKITVQGINVISNMSKGQNPVACSCVFDYVNKEKGDKEVILILDDLFDNDGSSENLTWIYDCDFEFLKSDNIHKIIIGGKRSQDYLVRLLLAGINEEKLVCVKDEKDTVNYLSMKQGIDIYILFELYDVAIADKVREDIINRINGGDMDGKN